MQEMQIQPLGWEDLPGEGRGNPLQYSCLGNPRTKELGRLQSMGLQRVGHSLATKQQQYSIYMDQLQLLFPLFKFCLIHSTPLVFP